MDICLYAVCMIHIYYIDIFSTVCGAGNQPVIYIWTDKHLPCFIFCNDIIAALHLEVNRELELHLYFCRFSG